MKFADDEMRIVSLSAPVWLKMLADRERKVLNKIHGLFRNGKIEECTPELASFCEIREQISEITNALREQETKEK